MIFAAIPWASSGAERSRLQAAARNNATGDKHLRAGTEGQIPQVAPPNPDRPRDHDHERERSDEAAPSTVEEELLAALLAANEQLTSVLRQYEDLEQVGIERETEERSRKETRIDRNVRVIPQLSLVYGSESRSNRGYTTTRRVRTSSPHNHYSAARPTVHRHPPRRRRPLHRL